ncbi:MULTISPECIES: hypothetical protein [unclassified Cryobacterium]|uniref:hypothetical protein n=1 Tax=unclassified Cryobacterium TaxID=2649013 RepID=UPI00106BCA12|nr:MULTISPECIES: hypothetical protein [unclassified Cryobacterium]MEB0266797.1 hypothetical protein [Cryobacterium sp. 10I5]TFD23802.1 hypothetical protein E3T32_04970 [Cryobacterium sp. TMT2-23]
MFDLFTTTGVFFTYSVRIPDQSKMQLVQLTVESPYTDKANVLMVNVATLATVGRSVETTLIEHVEHYERIAASEASKNA